MKNELMEIKDKYSFEAFDVTFSGMFTELRLEHPLKAISPILLTEFGIVKEVRDWQ